MFGHGRFFGVRGVVERFRVFLAQTSVVDLVVRKGPAESRVVGGVVSSRVDGVTPSSVGGVVSSRVGGVTPSSVGGVMPSRVGGVAPSSGDGMTSFHLELFILLYGLSGPIRNMTQQ